MTTAFDSIKVGRFDLRNRVAMAPMTRSRAHGPGATPTPPMATYYGQRASAGLIITEGTQPSAIGQGYPSTPGLHTAAQVAAWQPVTAEVHAAGGVIFAQLMHTGRIGHPSLYAEPLTPVGASPVAAAGQVYTAEGPKDFVVPEPLSNEGVLATIADFVTAARNARAAGFDGVELHGANGYLLHQFLSTNANTRDDQWGGSIEGRIRLTVEVTKAVAAAIGADRLGLRLSPANPFNDIVEDGHRDTYRALVATLDPLGLAYLHIAEGPDPELTVELRQLWSRVFILNPFTPGAYTGPDSLALIENGAADMVSFATLFLANPDLPARLAAGGPFNALDYATAYGGGESGYIDYPALAS